MYSIYDLRTTLARDGQQLPADLTTEILTLPHDVNILNMSILENLPLIEEKIIKGNEAAHHLYFSCAKNQVFIKLEDDLAKAARSKEKEVNNIVMIEYSDQNADKELIYGLSVDQYVHHYC
jgi:hypothetical protein